jgi:hypothetical protein
VFKNKGTDENVEVAEKVAPEKEVKKGVYSEIVWNESKILR